MRWTPFVLLGLLLLQVGRQATRPLSDPDTFWHLRLGHLLLDQGSLSTPDWAHEGPDWVLTQWLPEVVAARFEDWFGLPGVAWLFAVALCALLLGTYLLCRRTAEPLAAAFVAGLAILAMSASLSPRPHLITYLLLVVTLGAWLRAADTLRPPWWLVPLTWLWAMCHGMWFVGPLTGLVVVLGLRLDRRAEGRALLPLLAVPTLSVVAAALTPVGPKLLTAPVAVAGVGAYITEWQSPSIRSLPVLAGLALVTMVAFTWARAGRRVPWVHLLLLSMALGWMLLAVRTVSLGAIVITPLAAASVQTWLGRPAVRPARPETGLVVGMGLVAAILLAFVLPHTSQQPDGTPDRLSAQLSELAPDAVVINDYKVGGWLRWRHPELQPYVDGLTEAWGADRLADYGRITAVAEGWEDLAADSGADVALLRDGSPLATALEDRLGWRVAGFDEDYVLLVSPAADAG